MIVQGEKYSAPKFYDEEGIGCDECPLWFHLK